MDEMPQKPLRPELLRVTGLKKHFPIRGGVLNRVVNAVQAVNDVTFTIRKGEVVGLVGESGSGKTTVGRTVLRLEEATAGKVEFDGIDIGKLPPPQMRKFRRRMQIVFQDPYASLNPREKVRTMLMHTLGLHAIGQPSEREERAVELLAQVGLSADYIERFPHEFSGGQRQRIGIARALAVQPEFIVADEPVSALDVSIQAQIINLLDELRFKFNLTMLFIAHDLAVVEHISDRVIVMYLGRVMEVAPTRKLYSNPSHPYTQALLSAMPSTDLKAERDRVLLIGDIPSPINPPSGCVFRTRCPVAFDACARIVPPPVEISPGHFSACLRN